MMPPLPPHPRSSYKAIEAYANAYAIAYGRAVAEACAAICDKDADDLEALAPEQTRSIGDQGYIDGKRWCASVIRGMVNEIGK